MDFISPDEVEVTLRELTKQMNLARIDKDSPSLEQDLDIKYQRTQVLYKQGRFREAETLETQRLLVLVALHGFEDKRTLESMDSLSSLRFNVNGQLDGGRLLLDTVIALRIKTQGANHPETLGCLASKVANLLQSGRSSEAEQLGQQVVDMCKASLAPSDAARLRAMSNLASVYTSTGDLTKAEEILLEILRIREDTLPYDAPDTVRSKVNLSGVYFGQKRWEDAVLLLEPALSIRRRTMGDDHPMTMSIARQLAHAYSKLEGQTDNLTVQLLILHTAKKTHGEDHEQTLDALLGLIPTYIQRKMWKEAIETTEQLLEKQKKRVPADDRTVIDLSSHLETLMREFPNRECRVSDILNRIYRPLRLDSRQIRIAYITKGSRSDPLEATLLRTSLDVLPSYEALSYVWGKDQSVGKLVLNGHSIDITPNLQGALVQLRSSAEERLIWIDAICINQEDPEERGKQVQLMREIYSNARRVIVWLGEEAEDTTAGVEFLKQLEAHPSPQEHAADVLRTAPNNLTAILNGMSELILNRPYWNRLWIVQEVMCAKDLVVHCGSLTVGYEILGNIYNIILEAVGTLLEERHPATPRYLRIVNLLLNSGVPSSRKKLGMPLEKLLTSYWSSECSDPKHRIYALLGISSLRDSTHPGLKVDYSQSTSEVYRGATRAIVEETGRLDVLCSVTEAGMQAVTQTYRARQPFLPSWVPDWNVHRRTAFSLISIFPHSKASGDAKAEFGFSSDGTRLNVIGLGISSLEHCGQRFEMAQMRLKDIMKLFLGWRNSTLDYSRPWRGGGGGRNSMLRKFYAMLHTNKPEDTWAVTDADWSCWESTSLLPGPVDSALSELEKQFLRNTYQFCVGRRLFYFRDSGPRSLGGFNIGLSPNEATEGDLLCVIPGCPMPIVLHPVDEHFLVVGEAYVPDYMMGEAMEGKPQLQIFTLH